MEVVLGDTAHLPFLISSPTTGLPVDADSTPALEIFEEGAASAMAYVGAVVDRANAGQYSATIAATTANGFEREKYYEVWVAATVATGAYRAPIGGFKLSLKGLDWLTDVTRGRKEVEDSGGGVYELVVYGADDVTEILRKTLKDVAGSDITAPATGALAREALTSV